MLAQVGEQESSKSAMNALTGAFSALMTILRSTGPVISTRRSCRSGGVGAIRQSPARIGGCFRQKVRIGAGVDLRLPAPAVGEQRLAPNIETPVQ